MSLLSKLDQQLGLCAVDEGVLVAWSGGIDSTVLLHLLTVWSQKTGAQIAAVHVDHQLRASSKADEAFCRRVAHRWGVPLVVETLELRQVGSMQESARLQRYAAVARAAQKLGLGTVVTAHHGDDAVETALLNFRRGTATGGLSAGITATKAPTPSWPDLRLVRPLAAISKQTLRAYAAEHQITWRSDPTNERTGYERNRLRQEALPALTDDGALFEPILDTLENLALEHRAIEAVADDALARAMLAAPDAESLAVDCAPLRKLPQAVLAVVLKRLLPQMPVESGFGRDHLRQISDAIMVSGTVQVAARGVFVTLERDLLLIEVARGRGGRHLHDREAQPLRLAHERPFEVPWFGSWLRCAPSQSSILHETSDAATHHMIELSEACERELIVRGARAGDRIDVRGMSGHKSVSALLAEAGVPRAIRWRWPLVACGADQKQVVWVCGLRRREKTGEAAVANHSVRLCWTVDPASIFARILGRAHR